MWTLPKVKLYALKSEACLLPCLISMMVFFGKRSVNLERFFITPLDMFSSYKWLGEIQDIFIKQMHAQSQQ